MATTSQPTLAIPHPGVNPKYSLEGLPSLPSADTARNPLDSFRLAVAQLLVETWDVDLERAFAGVDIGRRIP
jgi:arginyl-tRNA synthetase